MQSIMRTLLLRTAPSYHVNLLWYTVRFTANARLTILISKSSEQMHAEDVPLDQCGSTTSSLYCARVSRALATLAIYLSYYSAIASLSLCLLCEFTGPASIISQRICKVRYHRNPQLCE